MNMFRDRALKGLACSASAIALVVAGPAWAQEEVTDQGEQVDAADGECAADAAGAPIPTDPDCANVTADGVAPGAEGAIVVTGSRVKRDTYTSISPLQVITTEAEQDVGMFDPTQILQRSEAAAGTQIDATFAGFVLDNGPGSQTVDLRGLGADRTLLLINGRRLAPAGVEGAPTQPSINLLPQSLIARYELLLEGASSVYGSDAIAGVGNIILRKDFEGPELFASGNINPRGGGDDYTVSAAWGKTFNNGFIGLGLEYAKRDEVLLSDRDFLEGCDTHLEIDQNGNILKIDKASNAAVRNRNPAIGVQEQPCKISGNNGRIFIEATNFGSVYLTPGMSNANIPNFSETTLGGRDIDANGDGIRDVDLADFNTNGANPTETFVAGQKTYNAMAYGEFTFPGAMNLTPFFEANYSRFDVKSDNSGDLQLFPYVPANNPFNPCNFVSNPNGVDCRARDNLTRQQLGVLTPANTLSTGFILPVEPIFALAGDRTNGDITVEQYRGVLGLKGDLPFIAPSWSFESAAVYSRSHGTSSTTGVREDKLAFALGIDPTGDFDGDGIVDNNGNGVADDYEIIPVGGVFGGPVLSAPCNAAGLANPNLAAPDLLAGCVPVNLFATSVLSQNVGSLATQAETDYVFDSRDFVTTYEQVLLSTYLTGNLFKMPQGGDVALVIGGEYRNDSINSVPDLVASDGLFFGFFSDLGAVGSKRIMEGFAELDMPLLLDQPGAKELRLNLSGRATDEEFYGFAKTYAVKLGWRPIDQLLLKMSHGTSFRAPNLRENFLLGQSGFPGVVDPCAVPNEAFVNNMYVASLDTREPSTLANCIREGRDPTRVGVDAQNLNTTQLASPEATSGGSLDLNPETSKSFTTGFAFEEKFGALDFNLNVNYYNIRLKNSIITPSSQFILNDCFTRQDGIRSQFCDRLQYGTDPSTRFLVSFINSGYINLNQEKVKGMDFNANFGVEVPAFGRNLDLNLNLRANHLLERSNVFIDDNGVPSFDEDAGEFGFPKWTGRATFTADIDRWRFTWQTRYIGPVEQSEEFIDLPADAFGFGPDGVANGFVGDTCTGGGSRTGGVPNGRVVGDGVFCRDVGFAGKYFTHAASIRYEADTWEARLGVTNVFDREPPEVDSNEVFAISNVPVGNGYDLDGREFFGSIQFKF